MTARLDSTGLVATSVPVAADRAGPTIDALALSGHDGVYYASGELTLAGWGVAARLQLDGGLADAEAVADVQRWLAAVPIDDRVGCRGTGLVAQGALPFDREAPAVLVVAACTYGADRTGRAWLTVVHLVGAPPDLPLTDPAALADWLAARSMSSTPAQRRAGSDGTTRVEHPHPEPSRYAGMVAEALVELAAGGLSKVVLGRAIDLEDQASEPPDVVLRRLQAQEPLCTAFSYPVPGGRFIGASPELLVARSGDTVRCLPLAGTVANDPDAPGGDPGVPPQLASVKERLEHRVVVDDIAGILAPHCVALDVPAAPDLVRLHTVTHLGTAITATLRRDPGGMPGVLDLLGELHPTPAVGGVPTEAALHLIEKLEPLPRQHWAGPVGWVDGTGDGEWVIGIRSATFSAGRVRLWAGAGIVTGTDPGAELAETTLKLQPVLAALDPGPPSAPAPASATSR